jgi:hypothetical protein
MTVGMCAAILGVTIRGAAISAPVPPSPSEVAGSGDGEATAQPQVSTTVVPETAASDEKSPAPKPGLGGTFTYDNSVLGSAFYTNPYINDPAWTMNLYLKPDYTFKVADQTLKFQVWETLSYSVILDKTSLTSQRTWWSDMRLSILDAKLYEEPNTHIKLNGFIRGSIPLSQASQFATLYTAITAGVGIKKSLYGFDLGLGVQAAKNFNKYSTVQYTCGQSTTGPVAFDAAGNPIVGYSNGICRPGDTTSTIEGVNISWSWAANGTVAYHFTDKLSLSATLWYFSGYNYQVPFDGNSSQIKDANGNFVAQSNGHVDGFWGITDLGYAITDHWSLDVGIWNGASGNYGAPPETQQGHVPRNPFFDNYNLYDWSMFFDITATL